MELISKEDVMKIIRENNDWYGGYDERVHEITEKIIALPTIEERKTGKWVIKRTERSQVIFPHCSCCDWYSYNWVKHPFCPNCGAKMEGAEE